MVKGIEGEFVNTLKSLREKIKTLEDDPGGWYCYTAVMFVGDGVLLGHCAGQRKTGGLALTQITRFSLDWLYR